MNIHYSIRDFMATKLITFSPETAIETAIQTFLTHKISGAPVVNSEGKLVGILSEKDCMKTLFESSYYNNLGGYVKEYMSTEITSIDIHESLSNVAEKFMESRFRRFPVIEGDKLVGQISRRDILCAMDQLSKEKQSS
jgi:CBS domain-containing protein